MVKKFLQSLAFFILIFTLNVSGALASGKMEVALGEEVTLQAESSKPGVNYKWIVKKGDDIVYAQTNTIFNYSFEQSGEYEVNLTSTDSNGVIKTNTITVMAGQKFALANAEEVIDPLSFNLATLPHLNSEGRVTLINEGDLLFRVESLSPDILEYRIDRNIFEDSDSNGVANDDIDNSSDSSYLLGGTWKTTYDPAKHSKAVAEVTVVSREGKKSKKQIEVLFGSQPKITPAPVAIFDTTPTFSLDDQLVHLTGDQDSVAFYAKRSTGNIVEYRIDKNIFVDSDLDGNPENDIDNLNHPSFKTGDIWETTYQKTDEQIIAQLIVVSDDGQGSLLQRGIVFGGGVDFAAYEQGIRLVADKPFVLKGDPITFSVQGLALSLSDYTFMWDLDGDGVADKTVEGNNTLEHIFESTGLYKVAVSITDSSGNTGERFLEILAKDTIGTVADFEFTVDGNQVDFTDKSTVSLGLSDKSLDYQWSFGDNNEANFEEQKAQVGVSAPVYNYLNSGSYLVTLTVTDSSKVTDSKTAEVVIAQDVVPEVSEEEGESEVVSESDEEESSLILKILKILLYLVLVVVVLILLMIGGFLIVLKLQHPDLTFDELIDEMKVKLLTLLGVHEAIEPVPSSSAPTITPPTPKVPEAVKQDVPANPEPAEPEVHEPEMVQEEPAKETIGGKEIIEAEVEEEKPSEEEKKSEEDDTPKPASEAEKGPVPDWLKGA